MKKKQNANGDGSVWLRKDGRWSGGAYVRSISGRTERRYVYGKTRREALQKLTELQKRHDDGLVAGPAGLTIEQYLLEWLNHIKHHVRPQTYIDTKAMFVCILFRELARRSWRDSPFEMYG